MGWAQWRRGCNLDLYRRRGRKLQFYDRMPIKQLRIFRQWRLGIDELKIPTLPLISRQNEGFSFQPRFCIFDKHLPTKILFSDNFPTVINLECATTPNPTMMSMTWRCQYD